MTLLATIHLRCPTCRAIDWFCDSFVIVEMGQSGEIVRRRIAPPDHASLRAPIWSCTRCAYEVPEPSRLASALHEMQIAGGAGRG
jgi:hypothetical protein